MADVFLSYKSEDRDLVAPLAQALERERISVWWDQKISAGGTWRETITGALNDAKVVIAVWSKRTEDSAAAAWVFNEVDEAQRLRRPIIPVQIEPCAIPLGYRHVQCANLSGWRGDPRNPEWQEVLAGVHAALAGKRIGGAAPRHMRPAPSRGGGGGALVGLVLFAMVCAIGALGYVVLTRTAPASQVASTQPSQTVGQTTASPVQTPASPAQTTTQPTQTAAQPAQTTAQAEQATVQPVAHRQPAPATPAPAPAQQAPAEPPTNPNALADAIASGQPFRVIFSVRGDPCPISGDAYYTRLGSIVASGGTYDLQVRRGPTRGTFRWTASGPDQANCQITSNTHSTADDPEQHSFALFGRAFAFDEQGVVYDNNNSSEIFDVGHNTPPFSAARRVGRIELMGK